MAWLAAAQCVQVVDFTMVLPLGPDLTGPLGIPPSSLALLSTAYATGAALAGLGIAAWIDRSPVDRVARRRQTMVVALVGLALADVAAALSSGLGPLITARLAAGACGGPAAAMGLALLSDVVPEARRGGAMGVVMSANALAAIVGVPFGLVLAQWAGWQAPFFALASGAALVAMVVARGALAPAADALASPSDPTRLGPLAVASYALTFLVVFGSFLIMPNLSAFAQHNLGLARGWLPALYALGGCLGILVVRRVGHLVDVRGASGVGSAAVLTYVAIVLLFVVLPRPVLPVYVGFVLLLATLASRNVVVRTLSSRVPLPEERGRFMSLQSTTQQVAAASGSLGSAAFLGTAADGKLIGMPALGVLSVVVSLAILPLIAWIEQKLGPAERR